MSDAGPDGAGSDEPRLRELHTALLDWYAGAARPLPWRDPDCSPWGIFVSEVMAQQTPLTRVEPVWREWMARWPIPAGLAAEPPGTAIRAWGRLGYPRRALRLRESAIIIVERHGGRIPADRDALLELPGVGPYTAAAVSAFAFGARVPVVDTNVRRVLARVLSGHAHASSVPTVAQTRLAESVLPEDVAESAAWNVALMELGALVCSARTPRCAGCPLADRCAWRLAGRPVPDGPPRRGQAWEGTDRQVRGRIVQALREREEPVTRGLLDGAAIDRTQVDRCLASLVADGLVEPVPPRSFALPR